MQTKVSTKGQVVIPEAVRRRLSLRVGDPLDVNIEAGSIVLTPHKKPLSKAKIIADPVTGYPVLSAGKDAPVLRSRDVKEILANFP